MRPIPTAPLAAGTLIAGYAVASGTGSRPLGGAVLLAGGCGCARIWSRRSGAGVAARLLGVGLGAFIASHLLALAIGAWPSVLLVSAVTAAAAWTQSDAPALGAAGALALRPPAR